MATDDDVFEDLRQRLMAGGFEHGAKLRPDALKGQFGCSASTVREALFRLSTLGLVEFQEQRGFRAPPRSPERQHELTQMRILLESEGAILSIRQGGLEWESQLAAAHHKLRHIESRIREANDMGALVGTWARAEQGFHQTLIGACGSETLCRLHSMIYAQFRQQLVSAQNHYGYFPENIAEHEAILDAALARNEPGLRDAIEHHLARNLIRPLPKAG